MGCTSCGKSRQMRVEPAPDSNTGFVTPPVRYTAQATKPVSAVVVPKSTTSEKVKLRYYGGGMSKKVSSGCSSCRAGKSSYSVTTTETIMFVSEDSPNGLFKETFTVGHNYFVTAEQANYLLKLTYRDVAGKEQPKFRRVD